MKALAVCLVTIGVGGAALADPNANPIWNPVATTSLLSGQSLPTPNSVFVLFDDQLKYVTIDQANPTPASAVGIAKQVYRSPASWYEEQEFTLFDDGGSPTGHPIKMAISLEMAAYEITGVHFNGYVVGLIKRIGVESNGETTVIHTFFPGASTENTKTMQELFESLNAPSQGGGNGDLGRQLTCREICDRDFEDAKDDAFDRFTTNVKAWCVPALVPSFLAGCPAGSAICGWIFPAITLKGCCAIGGIVGIGGGVGACIFGFHEMYLLDVRIADRDRATCLAGCPEA